VEPPIPLNHKVVQLALNQINIIIVVIINFELLSDSVPQRLSVSILLCEHNYQQMDIFKLTSKLRVPCLSVYWLRDVARIWQIVSNALVVGGCTH
jgi:hypothetical protein